MGSPIMSLVDMPMMDETERDEGGHEACSVHWGELPITADGGSAFQIDFLAGWSS